MKTRDQLQELIRTIASDSSPVGMDAVYVHALILDKLQQIEERLSRLESTAPIAASSATPSAQRQGG